MSRLRIVPALIAALLLQLGLLQPGGPAAMAQTLSGGPRAPAASGYDYPAAPGTLRVDLAAGGSQR